jgi:hypothetical protein
VYLGCSVNYLRFCLIIDSAERSETMIAATNAMLCSHGLISAGTRSVIILAMGAKIPANAFTGKLVLSNGFIYKCRLTDSFRCSGSGTDDLRDTESFGDRWRRGYTKGC